jgi:hypothetical protein
MCQEFIPCSSILSLSGTRLLATATVVAGAQLAPYG